MPNPNDELLKALNKLEEFTQENLKEATRFEEVKDLLQTLFFKQYRKAKAFREKTVKFELAQSVSLIKNYLPLIEKYRHGTAEEQKFAELVTRTIEHYNISILSTPQSERDDALTIQAAPRVAYKRIGSEKGQKVEKLFRKRTPAKPPSQEEVDTLKLKAIRLIESDPSFRQAIMESLKNKDKGDFQEIDNDGKTVTLMQTWSELPGEVHRIIGAFKRESRHSIPIKDSFKVFLESTQPGHPYPPQHMGWSLSHWLIPSSVTWIDQIPLLQPLMQRKKNIAEALLPKGTKNSRARQLFRFKKIAFLENRLEYLTFHQELAHSIVKASPYAEDKSYHEAIDLFFSALAEHPSPFDALCNVSEDMNHIFIETPFEKVEEYRLNGEVEKLFERYYEEKERSEAHFLDTYSEEAPFDKAKKLYLSLIGKLIGDAAFLLLKLQLSEKLRIKPPPLSDFEMKIQACAFKHLIEFLDEIEEETDIDDPHERAALKTRMRMEIQSEIELFSAPTFEEIDPYLQEITEEIISYFHARFHASKSNS